MRKIISGIAYGCSVGCGLVAAICWFEAPSQAGQAMPLDGLFAYVFGIACAIFLLIGVLSWPWGQEAKR